MRETRIKHRHLFSRLAKQGETELFRSTLLPIMLLIGACLLWWLSLPGIDPAKMNDLGLISVLPISYYAALVIIAISFIIVLYQNESHEFILFLHILALIFIIHGTPHIVYGTVRYSWAWKHIGIIDYIQRHGSVNPTIFNLNAYHNWPGFFAISAFFNQVAGIQSSLSYAGWGPVFFNLLDLGALLVIYKTLSIDRRLAWLGVWFFFLFSWIGQDYFSPQALAYFLYLVAFAILLRFFRISDISSRWDARKIIRVRWISNLYHTIVDRAILDNARAVQTDGRQRLLLMATVVGIFIVIASSHQLTPVMLISSLVMLVIFQITNQRYLPILMIVTTITWIIFMAVGFLGGHMSWIVRSIGSLLSNVNENLINLNTASPGQQFVAKVDRLLSISVWVLGFVGLIRRYRSGYWDLPALLLAAAPIPILAMNNYGGEMLFRVYLFGLPFITFLAAALFFPNLKAGTSFKTPLFVTLVSFLLIPAFLISYYGKDRMYYFSPNEVAAAQFVYRVAPKGALILDTTYDWPRQFYNYEFFNYNSMVELKEEEKAQILQDPVGMISKIMNEPVPEAVFTNPNASATSSPYPAAYLILTRSQTAEVEMAGTMPANWFPTIMSALSQSSNFKVIYQNSDAIVYQFTYTYGQNTK